MATNGSNKPDNGDKDPWRQPSEAGPPDLLHVLKNFFNKIPKKTTHSQQPKNSPTVNRSHSSGILLAGLLIMIALWFVSGLFLVEPPQEAVILRFGKYIKTVGPGPHWIPRF